MTKDKERSNRIIARMIAGLSEEGLAYGRRCEYEQGYPFASDEQIQTLVDAEAKAGGPPHDLDHAALILADNIFAFRPVRGSPFDRSRNLWRAFDHWPRPEPGRLSPTAEDFDNAVRACVLAATEARLPLLLDDETPPTAPS